MSLISQCNFEQTTLAQVIQKAEDEAANAFDLVHLSLDSGRELILVAISGDELDSVGMILEGVRCLMPKGAH
ncbi:MULTISPECIES: hypothetical protein [unclassified Pseudomonas]|uniref:hypothetical protein n=1 Tax=unclassified Pseudomonas TaxID=196821 RepID=UPI002446C616|nr:MULTISPECIES: hypothetical protein [unclassified Pseudomonas]MDH0894392.1 hypothetical protein [Pseudomonas sp. GD03875]MDH1063313.1 hypothetical protein [Pseudomonas sp. GD03985]